jgi:L-2-hydroxyglutarate oxidase LhgO
VKALAQDVEATGGRLLLGNPVKAIASKFNGVAVHVGEEEVSFDRVVICAGLQSDVVAAQAGDDAEPAIVPLRGEYYRLVPAKNELVKGLIYPVPDPNYPFLGVHFTRRIDGGVDVGPNAVLALAREGYLRRDFSPKDLFETLRWPGFQKLARKHWKMGMSEMFGSVSKHHFLNRARVYVPELQDSDVVRGGSGVRAQAVDRDGTLVEDFRIHRMGNVLAVRNAPSPGATSSMAIAEYICDELFKI